MKTLRDPDQLLAEGLTAIREQFHVPATFPPAVLAAAETAARRVPGEHVDQTGMDFVTLDPASSTDLDQAFALEQSGGDLLLHYAIADVAWFVADGDAIDTEAWARGTTTYLPDGKASLYPAVLCEQAASLLPDGPRPAVVFTVRVAGDGGVKLDGAARALIRSRAKLAYDTVKASDLPAGFDELSRRIASAEERRGAARVDPPEQEVTADGVNHAGQRHFSLTLRPQLASERHNAALSLACNLAVADALLAANTGLFRVMAAPDAGAELRLRHTARAFAMEWPKTVSLADFERSLDPANPRHAAFMLAVRRAGQGASYDAYQPGTIPWHAAMSATYAHATAPLRRLADRYVVRAALAVANGQPVPGQVSEAFQLLPATMAKAGAHDSQIERAAIDLAESAIMAGREGEIFRAVVTDLGEQGARIQLCDLPIVSRTSAHGVMPGAEIGVRLDAADPVRRLVTFSRVS